MTTAAPWEQDEVSEVAPWEADEASVEGAPESTGFLKSVFPSTTRSLEKPQMVGFGERLGLDLLSDITSTPTRAGAAATSEQKFSDPDAYLGKGFVEQVKPAAKAMYGVPEGVTEFVGRVATDPVSYADLPFRAAALGASVMAAKGGKFAKSAKRGISGLSQIPQELIDRAVSPQGATELSEAAIRTEGGNLYPMAEDLAQRVAGQNAARTSLQEGSQARQLTQFEEELAGSLNRPGVTGATPSRGVDIPMRIEEAKTPMQEAYIAGDKASVGPLREKGVSEYEIPMKREVEVPQPPGPYGEARPPKTITEDYVLRKKEVTKGISEVLKEFKALSPDQGVPKITRGASGALKSILGMAEKQANSIDDLINLKGQLRSVRSSGGFEGNIFDASVDDLAFAKAEQVINQNIERSIIKADPRIAGKIIPLMRANNEQYAKTKEILSGLSNSMGRVENSDRVIAKVAAIGPKRSQELISAADRIPALKPVVEELRQGFVDDLILSAQKGGVVDPVGFAKRWTDSRILSPELKRVWLTPEQIKRIDDAVALSRSEIEQPGMLGEKIFGSASKPSIAGGARRLENIGTDANREAIKELAVIDAVLGLKGEQSFVKQATDVFEARQLGITKEGKLPNTPISKTGRSNLGVSLGSVILPLLGATTGASIAGDGGALMGLLAGGLVGERTGKIGSSVGAYIQSPAGAVAANKILNKWAIKRAEQFSARAGALARAVEKAKTPVLKARVMDQLKRELEKENK